MLPQTTQARKTEVEGDTTVSFAGNMGDGTPLAEAAELDPENQTADSGAEEAQQEETQVESDDQPSEKPPRAERRTEKLIDALKDRTDEVSELRKQLENFKGPTAPTEQTNLPPWLQPQGLPFGEEVSPEELNARVLSTAHGLVQSELSAYQSKVNQFTDYKDDLNYVESTYPAFKKGGEGYDPVKDKKLTELYSKLSKADPSTRLRDVADDLMGFHQAGQEDGQKELKVSVVRREAEAAVTPSQNGSLPDSKDSDWDSMTLKEKEAWMKQNGVWD